MKYSRIISTLFFLCAFFLISPVAEANILFSSVYRSVAAEGWSNYDDYGGADVLGYGDKKESYECGNFDFTVYGGLEFFYLGGEDHDVVLTEAYQNSNIIIEDNKLVIEGTGYSDNPYWNNHAGQCDGDAQSLIEIDFLIDQNYLLSLSGILYGYSTSWGESSSYFELHDWTNNNYIINKSGSDSGTTLDQSLILPSGAYHLKINGYDGRFEHINLVLEPAASVPIPQSLWLLLSGSILTFLYVRRRVMV